jgi:hypothetical protein
VGIEFAMENEVMAIDDGTAAAEDEEEDAGVVEADSAVGEVKLAPVDSGPEEMILAIGLTKAEEADGFNSDPAVGVEGSEVAPLPVAAFGTDPLRCMTILLTRQRNVETNQTKDVEQE